MARKKIREYTAKRLLQTHHKFLPKTFNSAQVYQGGPSLLELAQLPSNQWLNEPNLSLVVKPDMLFGQRGKHDLVGLKLSLEQANAFIVQRMGKEICISKKHGDDKQNETNDHHDGGIVGSVTTFIVERFLPHKAEFYLSLESKRLETVLTLSHQGGVEIESNWGSAYTLRIPVGVSAQELFEKHRPEKTVYDFATLYGEGNVQKGDAVWRFVTETFRVFEELDFTMLEFNPFCFAEVPSATGNTEFVCVPLDMRGELDDQAAFKNQKKWLPGVDPARPEDFFPRVFGHKSSPAEDTVSALDAQTGASLKLTILNPHGKIWLLVAGGGASVIYTDTVCDLGHSALLGNYGEYSGNPTDDDTFTYAKTVLQVATAPSSHADPNNGEEERRCLVIGGGIANFTDVKATFQGICRALLQYGEKLRASNFKIFVRRGGPNYEAALKMMKEVEAGIGVPVEIYGPETHMTRIVHLASEYITSGTAAH